MYLFAIKMPNVNYPPSMHGTYVGHHVDYTLQAFFDLDTELDAPFCMETAPVSVVYLPLVTTASVPGEGAERRLTFRRSDSVVEATAQIVKPAYCPGNYLNERRNNLPMQRIAEFHVCCYQAIHALSN